MQSKWLSLYFYFSQNLPKENSAHNGWMHLSMWDSASIVVIKVTSCHYHFMVLSSTTTTTSWQICWCISLQSFHQSMMTYIGASHSNPNHLHRFGFESWSQSISQSSFHLVKTWVREFSQLHKLDVTSETEQEEIGVNVGILFVLSLDQGQENTRSKIISCN